MEKKHSQNFVFIAGVSSLKRHYYLIPHLYALTVRTSSLLISRVCSYVYRLRKALRSSSTELYAATGDTSRLADMERSYLRCLSLRIITLVSSEQQSLRLFR